MTDQRNRRDFRLPLLTDADDVHVTVERCADAGCAAEPTAAAGERYAGWLRAARWARRLAWISLVWMCIEGAVGL